MVSGESVGGDFIGGKVDLALTLHAREEKKGMETCLFDSRSSDNKSTSSTKKN